MSTYPAVPVGYSRQLLAPQATFQRNSILGKRKPLQPGSTVSGAPQGASSESESVSRDNTGTGSSHHEDMGINNLGEGHHNEESDQSPEKRIKIDAHPQVTKEDLDKINREVLGFNGALENEEFYCYLCQTRLNSIQQLERHSVANEHLRRINSLNIDKSKATAGYCDICHVACSSEATYETHMIGKKHAKNVESYEIGKTLNVTILGDRLDQLLHKDVVAEGNGISLGLSTAMTNFFSLPGPFIGLQYALECGRADEVNPSYTCTLCNVVSDAHNFHLHFASSAHRINVLKKDYPDKYQAATKVAQSSNAKSEYTNHLRYVAAEIEASEGRKIELIKRKILRHSFTASSPRGRGRGSFFGRGGQPRGRGNTWGHGGAWGSSQSYYNEQGFANMRGRGNFQNSPNRGRGRGGNFQNQDYRGRGRGGRGNFRGGAPPYRNSFDSEDGYSQDFSQRRNARERGGRSRGSFRGRGGQNFGGANSYSNDWTDDSVYNTSEQQQKWRGSQRGNRGRPGFNRGKVRSNSYSDGYNSELFGSTGGYSQSTPQQYGQMQQPSPSTNQQFGYSTPSYLCSSPVQQSPIQQGPFQQLPSPQSAPPWGSAGQIPPSNPPVMNAAPSQSATPNPDTLINNLAKSSIETEEDADVAFKISTALTQALLAYKLKSVAKDVSNPNMLMTLLNGLQGSGSTDATPNNGKQ